MAGKKVVKESLSMKWILGKGKLTSDKINGREERGNRKTSSCVLVKILFGTTRNARNERIKREETDSTA